MSSPSWDRLVSNRPRKGLRGNQSILEFCQHKLAVACQELFHRAENNSALVFSFHFTGGTYGAARVSIVHGGPNFATVQQMEQIFRQHRGLFGDCRGGLARG